MFQEYSWGEQFKISRVAYENGIQDFKFGNETNNTIWINPDNMYIVDSEQVQNIYTQLNNFECYSFEGTTIIDPALDVGDIVMIDDKKVIYQGDLEYVGKFKVSISSKIQTKSKEETTRTNVSDKTKIRRVQSQINQVEGTITQLVQETSEYEQKITNVQQDIDGIKQSVESITDFTREKTQVENLYIDDIAEGEGYVLSFIVYGNTSYFNTKEIRICASKQPRQYGEAIYITTQNNHEIITQDKQKLIIGSPSYYIDSIKITLGDVLRNIEIGEQIYYDTLEVMQDGTIQVTRRIGIDSEGNAYLLNQAEKESIEKKFILPSTKEGIYYFIEECPNLHYEAKYIEENEYANTFLTKMELGTHIEQNAEAIKIAWNQITEFIQLMVLNNNASFAILDQDKKIMMSLDKQGQHFYNTNQEIFGEMGVKEIEGQNYISFSVVGDYGKQISDGMAWGITTKDEFCPILYIKNFSLNEENSELGYGELVLNSCNLVLNGIGTGIETGGVLILGDPTGFGMYFLDKQTNQNLLSITPYNEQSTNPVSIQILENISFYANQAGSNSLRIGSDTENYCLFTDEGSIYGKQIGSTVTKMSCNELECFGHIYCNNGVELFSLEEKKKDIEKYKNKALDEIKNTDIYYYNYKEDKENCKRRVGAIIGENYHCSKEIIGSEGKGIDTYSMISLSYKAIQEQQEMIENLQKQNRQKDEIIQNLIKRIEKLEEAKEWE